MLLFDKRRKIFLGFQRDGSNGNMGRGNRIKVTVEKLRWKNYGGKVTVEKLRWKSYGGKVTVEKLRWKSYGGKVTVDWRLQPEMVARDLIMFHCHRLKPLVHRRLWPVI